MTDTTQSESTDSEPTQSDPLTVGDLDGDRTVYYTSRTGGSDRSIHLDEDCWHLEELVWEKPARKLQDHREICLECVGESPTGGPEEGTRVKDTRDLLLATDADDVGRESAEEGDLVTDGGRNKTSIRVSSDRPAISYGPRSEDEWVLAVTTEDEGRVEIEIHEEAMYDLWTEVRNVPWPDAGHHTEDRARLTRQVVHAANDADVEMLKDALEALGVRR